MSEQENYYTVEYSTPLCTANQATVIRALDRRGAEEKFKRINPYLKFVRVTYPDVDVPAKQP